jgi:hypothetical protein
MLRCALTGARSIRAGHENRGPCSLTRCWADIGGVQGVLLITAILGVASTMSSGLRGSVPPCDRIDVRLSVVQKVVKKGREPEFKLSVRNASEAAVQMLDTRQGRRRDLGDNYYVLVVRTRNEQDPEIPIIISDPGPMADTDFFTLLPSQQADLPVTTPLVLDRLKGGMYRAYIVVNSEAYSGGPSCASNSVQFRVR